MLKSWKSVQRAVGNHDRVLSRSWITWISLCFIKITLMLHNDEFHKGQSRKMNKSIAETAPQARHVVCYFFMEPACRALRLGSLGGG